MSDVRTFRIHIEASQDAVWAALTDPAQTERYGYRSPVDLELRPGGKAHGLANEGMKAFGAPDVVVEGEVVEVEEPRRLVQTWRMLFDDTQRGEPLTRLAYDVEALSPAVTRVTMTHDVTGAPAHAALISGDVLEAGGGWPFVLSDLKSFLETGSPMPSTMG